MRTIVHSTDHLQVVLVPATDDLETANPRDADNAGVIWAPFSRYDLGDVGVHARHVPEIAELDEFLDTVREHLDGVDLLRAIVVHLRRAHGATCVLPVWLHDHSGLSVFAGAPFARDGAVDTAWRGWDTSYVGFCFDTARTRAVTGLTPQTVEQALREDVAEYDRWLTGDVWGYLVETRVHEVHHVESTWPDGTVSQSTSEDDTWVMVDDCWGFLGRDTARDAGIEAAATIGAGPTAA